MTEELPTSLRVRRFLSDWFPLVVAGLLLLTLLAGAGTYGAYASTEYETEEVVTASLNESTAFEHSAVVVNDTAIWSEGETVTDRPLYYMRPMPTLDVGYGYSYDASGVEGGAVTARTEAQLVVRARNDDGETLWRDSRPLASETSRELGPGETHRATFPVNVTRVAQRIGEIESSLGTQVGSVQVLIRARTSVEGNVGTHSVDENHTSELPLVVRPPTYRVSDARTVAAGTPLETETRREPVQPPLLSRVGAPLGLLVGLVALAGVAYASRRDLIELSETERQRCELARRRDQFDDWITSGEIPGIDQYQTVVKVSSLSGLVDLAIDTNNRVIEDDNAFYVLRGREDVAYVYAPPTSSIYDWLFGGFDFGDGEFEGSFGGSGEGSDFPGNGGPGDSGGGGPDVETLFDDDEFEVVVEEGETEEGLFDWAGEEEPRDPWSEMEEQESDRDAESE